MVTQDNVVLVKYQRYIVHIIIRLYAFETSRGINNIYTNASDNHPVKRQDKNARLISFKAWNLAILKMQLTRVYVQAHSYFANIINFFIIYPK